MTSEPTPSFPFTTDPTDYDKDIYLRRDNRYHVISLHAAIEGGGEGRCAFGIDAHHIWSSFCIGWLAISWCMLVGRA